MSKNGKKRMPLVVRIILKVVTIALAVVLTVGVGFLIFSASTELKTKASEDIELNGASSKVLHDGDNVTLLTWNVGYCGLDEEADFFMDGGSGVRVKSKAKVKENLQAITEEIKTLDPDIVLL